MPAKSQSGDLRGEYQRRKLEIRGAFETGASGTSTISDRASALDTLVTGLWQAELEGEPKLAKGTALIAVGGYGRSELYPYSDVDLMFLSDSRVPENDIKGAVRRVNQELWDSGLRVAPAMRRLAECEKFDESNAEFTISLLDHRLLTGDGALYEKLCQQTLPKLIQKERQRLLLRIAELTRDRHAKYGGTLFHLEPNIKECPGGLRDVHVCGWMDKLTPGTEGVHGDREHFQGAVEFLRLLRCFLHYRHDRDDNTLDWQAQDAASAARIGLAVMPENGDGPQPDAAYWMRLYFRHARTVERMVSQRLDEAPEPKRSGLLGLRRSRKLEHTDEGFRIDRGRILLEPLNPANEDPAHDPNIVLKIFATMSRLGCKLGREIEARLSQALPLLSTNLEEGPALWLGLREVLSGPFAGDTLRAMHALGILELLVPEFHGIDALVIRDAYHRYTVDEHTFVLIDTLHALQASQPGAMAEWAKRFGAILRELPHPELLYLAALLHDTGKGRNTGDHASESVRMARSLLERLELDAHESGLILAIITNHLEMSAALRRDIFDAETIETFAAKVQTPEALKMLALFTYADIQAVHPDALTPWKAENLWRLYMSAANHLDRSVDEERVGAREARELVDRVAAGIPGQRETVVAFLEGFPERYVLTRSPEQMRAHFAMTQRFEEDPVQIGFNYAPGVSEITLVTPDRRLLFANMAGVLAAWGMNIITADAFSNQQGVVVDSFRFTDSFKTLELNESEHQRFIASVHDVMAGKQSLEKLLSGRRRGRRKPPLVKVEPRVEFDDNASTHSTLIEVVAQDTPGLLRALSATLADQRCNIEVALVDTEGETAIDVFYVTRDGQKLELEQQAALRNFLLTAMEENAR